MTAFGASLAFFLLVYAAAIGLWGIISGRRGGAQDKFADLAVQVRIAESAAEGGALSPDRNATRAMLHWARKHIPQPDVDNPRVEKLAQELVMAGFRQSDLFTFEVVRVLGALGLALVGAAVGWLASGVGSNVFVCAFAGLAVGFMAPSYYIKRRARLRQATIANELSDALDLLVVSVEAGLGLNEAIKVVGTEAERQDQEIGRELALVAAEVSAGRTMGEALRSLAERSAVEDVKPLAATLIQSEQLGSKIGPALRASADALRAKRRLRAEENAQKLSVKILVPLVLLVLPAMLMLIIGPAMIQIARTLRS
jgi:tight adherence protein C